MESQNSNNRNTKKIKKEIEDFFKSWIRKSYQKGVKDVKVTIAGNVIVLLGIDFLTLVELSITGDDYSKQLIVQTRKKVAEKNLPVLTQNAELIAGSKVQYIFLDFSMDNNIMCMTLCFEGEIGR